MLRLKENYQNGVWYRQIQRQRDRHVEVERQRQRKLGDDLQS